MFLPLSLRLTHLFPSFNSLFNFELLEGVEDGAVCCLGWRCANLLERPGFRRTAGNERGAGMSAIRSVAIEEDVFVTGFRRGSDS